MYLQRLIYLSFLLLPLQVLIAQDGTVYPREQYFQEQQQQRHFSNEKWLETIDGIDYSGDIRQERQEDENFFSDDPNGKKANKSRSYEVPVNTGSAFWTMILKFFIIVAAIALIAFIIVRFLGPDGLGKPRSKKINPSVLDMTIEEIEENIHESDLDRFIREAIEAGNYPLAIRLYYLAVIKELSLKKLIRWKRDKTNRDYIGELSGQDILPEFREMTSIFERIWYGEHLIGEQDFAYLQPRFVGLMDMARRAIVSE